MPVAAFKKSTSGSVSHTIRERETVAGEEERDPGSNRGGLSGVIYHGWELCTFEISEFNVSHRGHFYVHRESMPALLWNCDRTSYV